jgi:hypothetical protein
METTLMAENVVGSLYHAALDYFFKKAKAVHGGALLPLMENGSLSPDYNAVIAESVNVAIMQFSTGNKQFEISALTGRLLRAEKQGIQNQLEIFITALLSYFAGYHIAGSELNLSFEPDNKPYFLTGKVDCVLEDRRDSAEPKSVIIDFKLNSAPSRKSCTGESDNGLEDFQLPMYVTLVENNGYKPVHTALFFSIRKAEPTVLFGVINSNGKVKPYHENDRIERTGDADNKFDEIMTEFNKKTECYAEDVLLGKISAISDDEEKCYKCKYHTICRTSYAVDRRSYGT